MIYYLDGFNIFKQISEELIVKTITLIYDTKMLIGDYLLIYFYLEIK